MVEKWQFLALANGSRYSPSNCSGKIFSNFTRFTDEPGKDGLQTCETISDKLTQKTKIRL